MDELYQLYHSAHLNPFIDPMDPDNKVEEVKLQTYIEQVYPIFEYGYWAVIHKADNRLIGKAGLANREIDGKTYVELGYLIQEDYRRKGYGTQVCKEVIRLAKQYFFVAELYCFIHVDNHVSYHFAKTLGFKRQETVTLINQTYIKMKYL